MFNQTCRNCKYAPVSAWKKPCDNCWPNGGFRFWEPGESRKLSAYFSHSIRGMKGNAATQEDMDANNQKAIDAANQIRKYFPGFDLYVPAEHDEVLSILYRTGAVTIGELLDADCEVMRKRDFLIVYVPDGFVSNGMMTEVQAAQKASMPIFILASTRTEDLDLLGAFIVERFLRG